MPKFYVSEDNKKSINDFIEDFREPNKDISDRTKENDRYCLRKLSNFLKAKNIKDANEKELKQFFRENKDFSGYNLLGMKLTVFYRWLEGLNKREVPKRMSWFEYSKTKYKDTENIKKDLITNDEYKKILENSGRDRFGMWQAIWETFWLSGARLSEIGSMKIKHVRISNDEPTIYVPESKTRTREIPLEKYPYLLERWINNHPFRNKVDAPLWISNSTNNFGDKLTTASIGMIFWKIKKKTDIKQNLSVHNFRKTRFTIMSNRRSNDGGLIYSDSQLALFFGWSKKTVSDRREQYDLTSYDELKETVFGQDLTPIENYDVVKSENKKLRAIHDKELAELKKDMERQKKQFSKLLSMYGDKKSLSNVLKLIELAKKDFPEDFE